MINHCESSKKPKEIIVTSLQADDTQFDFDFYLSIQGNTFSD